MSTKNIHRAKICIVFASAIVVVFLFILSRVLMAHNDVGTRKAAESAGQKVEAYIDKNKSIPDDISAVTIKLPKTVRYEKVSSKTFQFCEYFYRNNDPSVSKIGLFKNLLFNSEVNPNLKYSNSIPDGRYGTLVVSDVHLAGIECQTVDYYAL